MTKLLSYQRLGFSGNLFLLPFDHRSSIERDLFDIKDRLPTAQEAAEITDDKKVIYDAFIQAVANGIPKKSAGILVDEQFGADILIAAKTQGYQTACCVEKSGQEEFDFEYGDAFKDHIFRIKPDFVKALVRYNPEDDPALNERQLKRLKILSQFCHENAFRLMIELLVPATKAQLTKFNGDTHDYDRSLRPDLMVRAIKELHACDVEPDIWKVEGLHLLSDYEKIVHQARMRGRENVALIVLGRGEDRETIKQWLSLAAQAPGFAGFAIGRTVWEDTLKKFKAKQISQSEAIKAIADDYKYFCDLWIHAKSPNLRRYSPLCSGGEQMINSTFDLSAYGINVTCVNRNLGPAPLYEWALAEEASGRASAISSQGALISYSGEKTGRSPRDKRIVDEAESHADIWWGKINIPLSEKSFKSNLDLAVAFLNTRPQLYVVDGFAGWRPKERIKVRVICARPYHALFMHNMLIRPSADELKSFGEPDWTVYNAGQAPADTNVEGITSKASIDLDFKRKAIVILGTEYAGCMKKGVFTALNYILPKKGILSMHSSANEGRSGDTALFLGLSGTGKTTLSADPERRLIGDDEHGWDEEGIFNFEGGCYAKTSHLSHEHEAEIWDAIRFGSVLENVVYDFKDHKVNFDDLSITENTRVAYPLEYMKGAKIPAIGKHPKNIIFLTCDAYGVLPPISDLSPEQAMYHFISGYTAKVAGTEVGIKEPVATFSPCFGGAFMVHHPMKYAELLRDKMKKHNVKVWLINTGWTGGAYGAGKRIPLSMTRAMINAIFSGGLDNIELNKDPIFNLRVPTSCPGVPSDLLVPSRTWGDKNAYQVTAENLAELFNKNFEQYRDHATAEVLSAVHNRSKKLYAFYCRNFFKLRNYRIYRKVQRFWSEHVDFF